MSLDVVDKLLNSLVEIDEEHTICLHGGEPLLIGKKWFAQFIKMIDRHEISQSKSLRLGVQTNGLLIDERWVELFVKGNVDISLSVDGPPEVHDKHPAGLVKIHVMPVLNPDLNPNLNPLPALRIGMKMKIRIK